MCSIGRFFTLFEILIVKKSFVDVLKCCSSDAKMKHKSKKQQQINKNNLSLHPVNSLVYVTKSLYMYYLTLFSRSLYTYVYYAFVYMSVCLIRYLPPQAMTTYLSFGKMKNFYPLIRSSALFRGENRRFKKNLSKQGE